MVNGDTSHFLTSHFLTALTPPLIYKYAEGGRDFSGEARYNAIKRFLNEKRYEDALGKTIDKAFNFGKTKKERICSHPI